MVESRLLSGFSFSVSLWDASVLGSWSSSVLTVWASISISSEPVLTQGPSFTYRNIGIKTEPSVTRHSPTSQHVNISAPCVLSLRQSLPVHTPETPLSPDPAVFWGGEGRRDGFTLTSLVELCDPLNCVHAEH